MAKTKKNPWYSYLWIWSIIYFALGFFNILFAWLGLIYFIGIYAAIISTLVSNYAVAIYRKTKLKGYVNLKPLKFYYMAIFMLIAVTGLYYCKNFYLNILSS